MKRLLDERGLLPAPERGRKKTWRVFLESHWDTLAASHSFFYDREQP